jgi:hypothetical protein
MREPPNNRLQRTVIDKVPWSYARCPAAEPGRYTARTGHRSGKVEVRFRRGTASA